VLKSKTDLQFYYSEFQRKVALTPKAFADDANLLRTFRRRWRKR